MTIICFPFLLLDTRHWSDLPMSSRCLVWRQPVWLRPRSSMCRTILRARQNLQRIQQSISAFAVIKCHTLQNALPRTHCPTGLIHRTSAHRQRAETVRKKDTLRYASNAQTYSGVGRVPPLSMGRFWARRRGRSETTLQWHWSQGNLWPNFKQKR